METIGMTNFFQIVSQVEDDKKNWQTVKKNLGKSSCIKPIFQQILLFFVKSIWIG